MTKNRKMIHYGCAALMLVLLVLQFMPFWHYGDPQVSVSIQGYVWFPTDHKALGPWIGGEIGVDGFSVEKILLMPVLELVLCAAGILVCIVGYRSRFAALVPMAAGLAGVIGYLAQPAFRLGSGWVFHLLVCAALLALGILGFVSKPEA